MNKTEFVNTIAEKIGGDKTTANETVNLVLDTIVDILKSGNDVSITGFGKFYVADVAEREARNPHTGETMTVAAHKTPKFKFSSNLKKEIR